MTEITAQPPADGATATATAPTIEKYNYYCNDCGKGLTLLNKIRFDCADYCIDCLNEITSHCNQCGNRFNNDDISYCEYYDSDVCNDCYRSEDDNDDSNNSDNSFSEYILPLKITKSKTFKVNEYKNNCGLEIECLNDNLYEHTFSYNDCLTNGFSQYCDGSLSSNGVEFASNVFNGDLMFNKIDNFCKILHERKYKVNTECGLHIHIEVKKRLDYIKKLLLFYSKYENFFYRMVSKSRQNNSYCLRTEKVILSHNFSNMLNAKTLNELQYYFYKPIRKAYLKRIKSEKWNDKRYLWYNLHSVFHRKTIEIRLHNGTIDADKIKNWFLLHLTMLKFIENINIETLKLLPVTDDFFLSIFSNDLQQYIKARWLKFEDNNTEDSDYITTPLSADEVNN